MPGWWSRFYNQERYTGLPGRWRSRFAPSDQVSARRRHMMALSARIAQNIFQRVKMETLLADTVIAICDSIPRISHARIFLLDEGGQYMVLQAGTGAAGQELVESGYRLPAHDQNVIGRSVVQGQPVLVQDPGDDTAHERQDLQPDTRTELALPLTSGADIIGVLDVQSPRRAAFAPDDVFWLQEISNKIAIAIYSVRLFARQHEVITENERLVRLARAQLSQIQDLNRRLTRHAWGRYLDQRQIYPALTVDFTTDTMTRAAEWTPGLADAVYTGEVIEGTSEGQGYVLAVPLSVRGQVIGAMEFEMDDGSAMNTEQTALIQDVAARLSLSLENARLYEEAQSLAEREGLINNIGSRLQSAVGMEGALLVAAQGLQSALHAPRIAIRLGNPPDEEFAAPAGEQSADREAGA
jgi:GAF domain-containing protein